MADSHDGPDGGEERTERREVRSRDPSLSPEANRILTEELREVTGRDEVEVPAARPRTERERHGARPGLWVAVESNKIAIGMGFLAAVVVGAVISLATGSWWLLALAVAVDGVATLLVAVLIVRVTSRTEHMSPSAAARLEDEGVGDPDAVFSDLVHEYEPEDSPSQHPGRPAGP